MSDSALQLVECPPYRAKLTVAACVARHQTATAEGWCDREECLDCRLGRERAKGKTGPTTAAPRVRWTGNGRGARKGRGESTPDSGLCSPLPPQPDGEGEGASNEVEEEEAPPLDGQQSGTEGEGEGEGETTTATPPVAVEVITMGTAPVANESTTATCPCGCGGTVKEGKKYAARGCMAKAMASIKVPGFCSRCGSSMAVPKLRAHLPNNCEVCRDVRGLASEGEGEAPRLDVVVDTDQPQLQQVPSALASDEMRRRWERTEEERARWENRFYEAAKNVAELSNEMDKQKKINAEMIKEIIRITAAMKTLPPPPTGEAGHLPPVENLPLGYALTVYRMVSQQLRCGEVA